jgi:uncharacterized cupredoxin-like copper-binding protein
MSYHRRHTCLSKVNGLIVLIATALIVAACADSGPEGKTVALELNDAGLSPNNVTVSVGQPVELHVENRTGATHELAVADIPIVTNGSAEHNMAGMSGGMGDMAAMPPIHMMVRAGEWQSLMFTPGKAGQYAFKCLTPGHQEQGVLTVTD